MIRNISWNISAQIISFAVPLITLPLLVRRLGLGSYGVYTLSLLLWQSITILMDYSFNTVGVQRISSANDKSSAFNEILSARIIISIGCILLLPILSIIFLKSFYLWFIFGGVAFILGYLLINNQWYYSHEEFKLLAIINFISRTVLLVLIVFYAFNTISAMLMQCIAMLSSGIISLFASKYYKEVRFSIDSFRDGFRFIRFSRESFGASFIGYLLSNSPLLIGSFVLSLNAFGAYALADRVVRVFLALYGGASQVIFRRAVSCVSEGHNVLKSFILRTLFKVIPIYFAIILSGVILIYFLQSIIFHSANKVNFDILMLLSLWSVVSVFNSMIGFIYLQSVEKYTIYFYIMLLALCLTVVLIFTLGRLGSGLGITISLIFIEFVVASICFYIFNYWEV